VQCCDSARTPAAPCLGLVYRLYMDPAPFDPRRIEVIDDDLARVLRAKTGAERLRIAFSMFASARRMLINHLTAQHPEWDQDEVRHEAARRLSHGAV